MWISRWQTLKTCICTKPRISHRMLHCTDLPACAANISGVFPSLSPWLTSTPETSERSCTIGSNPDAHAWHNAVCNITFQYFNFWHLIQYVPELLNQYSRRFIINEILIRESYKMLLFRSEVGKSCDQTP